VDVIAFGRGIRALRVRRHWTQDQLARRASVSRSVAARVEQGRGDRVTVATLDRIAAALGARVMCRLMWQGEGLDRLLDAEHAAIVEQVVSILTLVGWLVATEVSFNIYGERGSIDILAFHPATGSLLVVEVKTVVPDIGGMLSVLSRKVRLASQIARERGWVVRNVSQLLVLAEDTTSRRRVALHAATFVNAFPSRTVAVKAWLRAPTGTLSGLMFLPSARGDGQRRGSRSVPTRPLRRARWKA
jgi:transcriptional regulator with XRE-family HTH domain